MEEFKENVKVYFDKMKIANYMASLKAIPVPNVLGEEEKQLMTEVQEMIAGIEKHVQQKIDND